jgi:4-oxalmesaconate hydratase
MGHHVGDAGVSLEWSQVSNELIHRVCGLFPRKFIGVCQLPQSPGSPRGTASASSSDAWSSSGSSAATSIRILRAATGRLRPDDRWWYPLYEKLVELDVPAMVHVSASCNPELPYDRAHYINADTTAFMQLLMSDLFKDFPTLR